jgi:hypothetical protein
MLKNILEVDIFIKQNGIKRIPDNFMATKHISWAELFGDNTEKPELWVMRNLLYVASILEIYRKEVFKNNPITITSAWRSENYNKEIGGAKNSHHLKGLAIDFKPHNGTIQQGYDLLDKIHFGGLERTNGDWIHIDLRGSISRFDNRNKVLQSHYDVLLHEKIFNKKG